MNSAEELFQEIREESRCTGVFAEKKKKIVKHQKIAYDKNRYLRLMILVLFYLWEDARVWTP